MLNTESLFAKEKAPWSENSTWPFIERTHSSPQSVSLLKDWLTFVPNDNSFRLLYLIGCYGIGKTSLINWLVNIIDSESNAFGKRSRNEHFLRIAIRGDEHKYFDLLAGENDNFPMAGEHRFWLMLYDKLTKAMNKPASTLANIADYKVQVLSLIADFTRGKYRNANRIFLDVEAIISKDSHRIWKKILDAIVSYRITVIFEVHPSSDEHIVWPKIDCTENTDSKRGQKEQVVVRRLDLTAFEADEAFSLIDPCLSALSKSADSATQSVADDIFSWAGYHPYALQLICYIRHTYAGLSNVAAAIDHFMDHVSDFREGVEISFKDGYIAQCRAGAPLSYADFLRPHGLIYSENASAGSATHVQRLINLLQLHPSQLNLKMDDSLPVSTESIFAVLSNATEKPVGVAFCVANGLFVTCTHVVRAAIWDKPTGEVLGKPIKLGLMSGQTVDAWVAFCTADPNTDSKSLSTQDEVCLIRTDTVPCAPLKMNPPKTGESVSIYGFPTNSDAGQTLPKPGRALIIGGPRRGPNGGWEIQAADVEISPGFSGSPVWVEYGNTNAFGMLRGKNPGAEQAYFISDSDIKKIIDIYHTNDIKKT